MRIDPFSLIAAQAARIVAGPPQPAAPAAESGFSPLEFPKAADKSDTAQGFAESRRLGARFDIKV